MKIIFFGDIVGQIGIDALSAYLPRILRETGADFVIANGENASKGKGLTERDYETILEAGVDCITLGNHYRSKDQIDYYIDDADNLIRPLNLKDYGHGVGSAVFDVNGIDVRVTNILGQGMMKEDVTVPHYAMNEILKDDPTAIHIVDFHGESTSEKKTFAFYFDGKVSAVLGTHTHVQTADARVLDGGTAFISDVGMCGAFDSVIGFSKESVIGKFINGENQRLEINEQDRKMVNYVVIEIDETTGKAISIENRSVIEGKAQ